MIARLSLFVALGAGTAAPASAQDAAAPARVGVVSAVTDCRAIADAGQRLACFDTAVARLQEAESKREVVIVDQAQVRETRRTLFGLALPRLPFFSDREEEAAEEIKEISGTARSASRGNDGKWLIVLADGARWRQVDNAVLASYPRAGSAIVIKRAALGTFKMNVDGQPGFRVRREN